MIGQRDFEGARPNQRRDLALNPPQLHPAAAKVFDTLERASIRWSLLRGEHRLAAPPHDVDLLVAASDLPEAAAALAPLGFVAVPTWARGTHQFFVAYDEAEDDWLQLDVVTELAYGPHYSVRTDAAAGCLARSVPVGRFRALCADDAFWSLLLHCVLDRGDVPPHQQERLSTLAPSAQTTSQLARVVAAAAPEGWSPERAVTHVRQGEWGPLLELRRPLIRQWARRHPVEVPARVARGALQWRTERLHRFLRLRGIGVLLTGADFGAVSALAGSLGDSFVRPVRAMLTSSTTTPSRAAKLRLAIPYRTARGEIVIVHAAPDARLWGLPPFDLVVIVGDAPAHLSRPALGSHLVVDASDPARARRAVTAAIWRRYRAVRGWDRVRRGK